MGRYDHREHAGNAGDVWKHFLLLEAADCLLDSQGSLVYAESHAGRPHYILKSPGEWKGGIGRIWNLLPSLRDFPYFKMLSDLNSSALKRPSKILYPGSSRQVYELTRRRGADLQAHVWDKQSDVAASWQAYLQEDSARGLAFSFHQSDGFSGLLSRLSRPTSDPSLAGLLFIDPPYLDPRDAAMAERLLQEARESGWIVLWWYMMDTMTAPTGLEALELDFAPAGLDGGRWKGAGVAVAGPEGDLLSQLLHRLDRSMEKFIRILKLD